MFGLRYASFKVFVSLHSVNICVQKPNSRLQVHHSVPLLAFLSFADSKLKRWTVSIGNYRTWVNWCDLWPVMAFQTEKPSLDTKVPEWCAHTQSPVCFPSHGELWSQVHHRSCTQYSHIRSAWSQIYIFIVEWGNMPQGAIPKHT